MVLLPKISVVMPVHNAEASVAKAIDSVLAQRFSDFELIIVDDGSTDSTPDILRRYAYRDSRVKIFRNESNLKIAKSLNVGLAVARSELVARMDADDVAHPERLGRQYVFLSDNVSVAVCGTGLTFVGCSGRWFPPTSDAEIRTEMFWRCPIAHPTVMYRRSVVLGLAGGYSDAVPGAEDYDLWVRLSQFADVRFANLPESLLWYRYDCEADAARYHEALEFSIHLISVKMLERFGVPCTQDERRCHLFLYGRGQVGAVKDLQACGEWAVKLFTYVAENDVCVRGRFTGILRERWMRLCLRSPVSLLVRWRAYSFSAFSSLRVWSKSKFFVVLLAWCAVGLFFPMHSKRRSLLRRVLRHVGCGC